MDPNIISSIIQATGTISAAIIAAITANLIGKKFQKQAKLKKDLEIALKDIEYLLAVEEVHCENNLRNIRKSNKNNVRKSLIEKGYQWSGKYTPGRVRNP